MIHINGSSGEGGGQIIRTALTLSAITKKEVSIENIRAGRPKPGLAAQHLTAVKAVRNVCRGTLEGAEIGSTNLIFHPGELVGGKYDFNIGTAGSVTLVAQTLIPILLKAEKESIIRIIGGTHVMKSPGYDYFEKVFIPAIQRMGAQVESRLVRLGFYPKGGGDIEVIVKPSELRGTDIWPRSEQVQVIIRNSNLPLSIAIREKKIFIQNNIESVYIRETQDPELATGNAVTAWAGFRGAYSLGEKGKRAEAVAEQAYDEIMAEKFDVDKHLADQLLIYAALAQGKTSFETSEFTSHLKTNAEIIRKFIDRNIKMDGNKVEIV